MCDKLIQMDSLLSESVKITNNIRSLAEKIDFNSRNFLGHAFDSLPFFIFIKDKEGNLLDCNEAFTLANGLPKKEILMKGWMNHATVTQEQIDKYFQNDIDVIKTGKPKLIFETLGVNNTELATYKMPLIIDNKIMGVIGVSMDISPIVEHVKEKLANGTR